jgi:hypothetical protein
MDRNPLWAKPCTAVATWDKYQKGSYLCVPSNLWQKYVEEAPLSNRAWVIQERLLAPRILHFGANQLFWECREHQDYESRLQGVDVDMNVALKRLDPGLDGQIYRLWLRTVFPPSISGWSTEKMPANTHESSILHAYRLWNYLIYMYASCKLTVASDKLVALSGIASKFRPVMCREVKGNEYLAGLWRYQMEHQLLWNSTTYASTAAPRPSVYRAPSWSWAAIDNEVTNAAYIADLTCGGLIAEILDAQVVFASENPNGGGVEWLAQDSRPAYKSNHIPV